MMGLKLYGGDPSSTSGAPSNNPFRKSGTGFAYELKDTETSTVLRVDMPGCPGDDLTYWVDGNNVHFFADEKSEPLYNHEDRRYCGSILFNPKKNSIKDANAKLVDGVLWVTIPKLPNKANV